MTALIVALSAAFAGVVIVLAARGFSLPGRRKPQSKELERAQLELRWARQLSVLAETLDLDELLTRVLQGAAQLANADAAAVALSP